MSENDETVDTEEDKRKYLEVVIRQFKPLVFGVLSTVCLVLASVEIVSSIFFIFSLAFLMATIITIITAQKGNTRKLKLV